MRVNYLGMRVNSLGRGRILRNSGAFSAQMGQKLKEPHYNE